MRIKKYITTLQIFFTFLALFCLIVPNSTKADFDYGVGRERTCNASGTPDGLDYDPRSGGKDVQFVLSNPVCISVIAYAYANTKIQIARMNSTCQTGDAFPRIVPSPILDFIDITRATIRAASTTDAACGTAVASAAGSLATSLVIISAIYGIAVNVYNSTEICGANWVGPNPTQYMNNSPNHKADVENAIFGKNGYVKNNRLDQLSFDNITYREWYYGGTEFQDNSDDSTCPDVTQAKRPDGSYPAQKYYMKGVATGNFNCKKYYILPGQETIDPRDGSIMSQSRVAEFRSAYNCCKNRARQYVCIKYGSSHKFCKAGSLCTINGIVFSAKSMDNGRLACAESYSLCPYNFAVGGGAEKCDFYQDGIERGGRYTIITAADVTSGNCNGKSEIRNADCTYNEKAGRCKNYCQFMTHCTQTDLSDYQYTSSITSPYFSAACFNFVGDSQNMMAYGTGFIAGSARHFGAPIAQCTKETIENIFYNRAGHTACRLIDDAPSNNNCPGGTLYRKGDQVQAASFFSILQNQMQFVVKLILTFSIIFYGAKILLGGGGIKSSELIMYIVKIALIMYFATGDAWQSMFFDGVYGASTVFSQMVFKIQTPPDLNKRDGCQFGNVNLDDDNSTPVSVSTYPPGKGYLAMWDALDCKMTRYLGFGPELSTANIVKLIIAGYLTGPIGIYFSVALLFFGLVMVSAVIRALQIFLSSCIAIVIMVYLSPLIFPLALFEKTKGIFKGWVTQVISFSLQPMILFAYLAIFVSIMDKTLIGSATFYGIPPARGVQCSEYCQDALGNVVNNPNCDAVGQKLVVPKADSVACMISNDAFGNWPGLELIGIGLPFLIDFFAEHTREKILTIMKAALIMYFLMKFMDEIPGITSQLIGGATLPASSPSAAGMMKSITGVLKGIQQRANRATLKWGGKGATGARSAINRILSAGDKGKSVSPSEEGSGSDDASSSKSGGKQDDAGSSQGGSNSASSSSPGGGESSSSSSKDESSA